MNFQHRGHRGSQRSTEDFWPELSHAIIGGGMRVHSGLGPGLLESVYEECLCHELSSAGLDFRRQVDIPVRYRDVTLAAHLRIDLIVEDVAIVEVKSVDAIHAIHEAQLLTYLRLAQKQLGLLMNFNVRHFRSGIHRKVM